jgi:hypothetical protein
MKVSNSKPNIINYRRFDDDNNKLFERIKDNVIDIQVIN